MTRKNIWISNGNKTFLFFFEKYLKGHKEMCLINGLSTEKYDPIPLKVPLSTRHP